MVAVVLLQQPVAAVIDAAIQVVYFGRPEWFIDYILEYLLWQIRMPTRAWVFAEVLANWIATFLLIFAIIAVDRKRGSAS